MRCIAIVALGALLCLPPPAKAELLVNVSKSQQRLSVTIDGAEAYRWPVSTGRRGHETPAGKFRPIRLERHWYSHEYGMTPMPWAVFFHRGYAVHGTMEAYNLGHAASHGCVRLRPDNASTLFSLVRHEGARNTRIVIMNGPLPATPGAAPLADAEQHFAKALDDVDAQQRLSAKEHADPVVSRVWAGNDEARVLRERQAWLASLDRKYGFTR